MGGLLVKPNQTGGVTDGKTMATLLQLLLTAVLVALVTLFGYIYWYFNNNYDYWKKRNIPYCKPELFFGNFKDRLLSRRAGAYIWQDLYNKLKGHKIGGVWFLRNPVLFLRDPELIKRILIQDFAHFHDRGMHVDEVASPLSAHLFNLSGTKWRSLRNKLTPTFTSGKMKMMFTLMHECSQEFVKCVKMETKGNDAVDFKEVFAKLTTDIIGTCVFGLQFNALKDPDSEFRTMGRKIFSPSKAALFGHLLFHVFPVLGKFFDVGFPRKEVSDFFLKAVHETVDYREKNNVKREDFLQLLIELKNKRKIEDDDHDSTNKEVRHEGGDNDIELTDNLLAAQAFVFFMAGFHTSSTTMSFALHELSINPAMQSKLREEIDQVTKEHHGEITYESIKQMVYLDKVINETLRKYPPLGTLTRVCNKDYHDADTGIIIEKGTRVEIPVYALHHDPLYYSQPEKFDPERFSEEEKAKRPSCVFLPFGEGPRICIGLRFGLLQTKLGLAMLLSHYELFATDQTPCTLDPKAFITSARGGVWVHVRSRAPVVSS